MAATSYSATPFLSSSNANFQGWAGAIQSQLSTGGWVQTADTGQTDFSVAANPTAGTYAGYQIWRTNDAAGSIVNYYMKIECGRQSSGDRPLIRMQFGWGSNGSGTLTGVTSNQITNIQFTGTPNATSTGLHISVGAGYFVLAYTEAVANVQMIMCVERTRDNTQAFQNQIFLMSRATSAFSHQIIDQSIAYPGGTDGTRNQIMAESAQTPAGGLAAVGLCFGMAPGPTSPSLNFIGSEDGGLGSSNDTVNVTMFNESHTYRIQNHLASTNHYFAANTTFASTVCLFRYE